MTGKSQLLVPPPDLRDILYVGIYRDTRGCELGDRDRFNYFPATPLVTVSHCIVGQLYEVPTGVERSEIPTRPPLPPVFVALPKGVPTISWSEGPVQVVSLCFYPDAWAMRSPDLSLEEILQQSFSATGDPQQCWDACCAALRGQFAAYPRLTGHSSHPGTHPLTIAEWAKSRAEFAALSGIGRGVRSVERRLLKMTGHSRRALALFARLENLASVARHAKGQGLADIAQAAGYADQSHMGRVVRRATGFSPARLSQAAAAEESSWFFRLLGQRG
jgi:AraC-like DNA-binding protein